MKIGKFLSALWLRPDAHSPAPVSIAAVPPPSYAVSGEISEIVVLGAFRLGIFSGGCTGQEEGAPRGVLQFQDYERTEGDGQFWSWRVMGHRLILVNKSRANLRALPSLHLRCPSARCLIVEGGARVHLQASGLEQVEVAVKGGAEVKVTGDVGIFRAEVKAKCSVVAQGLKCTKAEVLIEGPSFCSVTATERIRIEGGKGARVGIAGAGMKKDVRSTGGGLEVFLL